MSARTITVFVSRRRGVHHAATLLAEAIDERSALLAARRCAAEHFGVTERQIELTPGGEHMVLANVREPAAGRELGLGIACAVAAVAGVAAVWWVFVGGPA